MFAANLMIKNPSGLHARPASGLVRLCKEFSSEITIYYKEKSINAKSIVSVLAGGIGQNAEIKLTAEGSDESEAGPVVISYIENLTD